jgi:hypothetical protein
MVGHDIEITSSAVRRDRFPRRVTMAFRKCFAAVALIVAFYGASAIALDEPKTTLACNNGSSPIDFGASTLVKAGLREMTSEPVQFNIGLGSAPAGAVNVDGRNPGYCWVDMGKTGDAENVQVEFSSDQGQTWKAEGLMPNIVVEYTIYKSKITWYVKMLSNPAAQIWLHFSVLDHPN